MVVRGSGPNLQSELVCSGCPTGFPNPDLFDRFAHAGRRLLSHLPVFPTSGGGLQLHQYAAAALAGSLYSCCFVTIAQIVRAILLASATATSMRGLRRASRSNQEP